MPDRPRSPLPLVLALAALAAVTAAACGQSSPGFADSGIDADADDFFDAPAQRPDVPAVDALGRVCTRSSQCNDGVPCTEDFCAADNRCVNLPNNRTCDDGVYCNGMESCDVRRGCVRGAPITCNQNYTCEVDRCDEATKTCVHSPRDFDHDGDPDIHCHAIECGDAGVPEPGAGVTTPCWRGGDCDDTDPRVSSLLPEYCGDGLDNNCNGYIDDAEPGGCLHQPHDRCDDPLDVSRGGHFTLHTLGALGDYAFTCAGGARLMRDVTARLHLDAPHDVAITAANATTVAYLAVQTACGSASPPDTLGCSAGFPSVYLAHSLPAGDYYVLVGLNAGTATAGDVDLNVVLTAPTPPITNDTCAAPVVVPATGGHFTGDLIGAAGSVMTRCSGGNPTAIYALTLTAPHDVMARVAAGRSDYPSVSLVDHCTAAPTTLRCASGAPATFNAHALAAGTYFVVVQGANLAAFTLDVTVGPPTTAPAGDTCAMPLALTPGTTVMGSLIGLEADYMLSCVGGTTPDAVYSFTLADRSDVTCVATGGSTGDYFFLGLRTACTDVSRETACRSGSPARLTARGLDPGTYYVIVKGLRPVDFTLALTASPPVVPMNVSGNETCATAAPIPSGGGLFMGSTLTLHHGYTPTCRPGATGENAVFRYHSDRRQTVSFSTEGTGFDTVLWLTQATGCPGPDVPMACNDDGPGIGLDSSFDVVLDPGDYYLFLGGFSPTAHGPYTLAVTAAPAP